jgi:hypothetical protein
MDEARCPACLRQIKREIAEVQKLLWEIQKRLTQLESTNLVDQTRQIRDDPTE